MRGARSVASIVVVDVDWVVVLGTAGIDRVLWELLVQVDVGFSRKLEPYLANLASHEDITVEKSLFPRFGDVHRVVAPRIYRWQQSLRDFDKQFLELPVSESICLRYSPIGN